MGSKKKRILMLEEDNRALWGRIHALQGRISALEEKNKVFLQPNECHDVKEITKMLVEHFGLVVMVHPGFTYLGKKGGPENPERR
jgi:hypothetical protein